MTETTQEILQRYQEVFEDAEIVEGVPDGRYDVNIEKGELVESRNGSPMLKLTLRIIGPDYEGQLLWRYCLLATPDNVRWLKRDLHRCGLDLERLTDLPDRLTDLLDVKLEVVKKTKGEYSNIYINKRLEIDGGGMAAGFPT